ncbi:heme peroxidase [Exidia glandulosa HHB12029]|uniref:Peroxidase n=1 Tax=Exidia glandulosa HHB12029 TaxID=1314781 RepID=A0A165JZL9_EXIGL|nr:heme peroxidase [Exidia glandulosa HHB12029]
MLSPVTVLKTLLLAGHAVAYIWPNPRLDKQESLRWDQDGWNGGPFASFLTPCNRFDFGSDPNSLGTGRSNAADWIRSAYHDMATHNVEDGTGGLDASIRFFEEQHRPENAGNGFLNTMIFLTHDASSYASLADILTLAALSAIEHCGGPKIAYRAGRVDALEPNAPGVPEPQDSVESHIANFARQGFTQEEMIGLVACGHTFGGVQHTAFSDIVPDLGDPNDLDSNAPFDSTFVSFDNKIATEFLDGTTANPLIVGSNDTTNSDKRIFVSDGNVTMKAFAESPNHFASTCATLFARMLDTVPRGVQLTEVINPLSVKPHGFKLLYMADGLLNLTGEVRLWDVQENPARSVHLVWSNSDGSASEENISHLTHTADMVGSALGGRVTSAWYKFPRSFITLNSISKFHFIIDEGDGSAPRIEDQDGHGFVVQDSVVWSSTSCAPSLGTARMDIAVSIHTLLL